MNVGQEIWLVAAGFPKNEDAKKCKQRYEDEMQKVSALRAGAPAGQAKFTFSVPEGDSPLVFGSFDTLIKLTDDLAKADSQVDAIVHRVERQFLEVEPNAKFTVTTQRQPKPFEDYIRSWKWDEAKYPKNRSIQ